jgi:hypothetical protein
MRLGFIKSAVLAGFVATAVIAAPAAAQAAPAAAAVGVSSVAVAPPSGDVGVLAEWKSAGFYLNKDVCNEHGRQYVAMGLAYAYRCTQVVFGIYQLEILPTII